MSAPWTIDELAHAGPEHLDPAFVAGYDRKSGHDEPGGGDAARDVAVLLAHGLGPSSSVLDLAAGTGAFTAAATRAFGRVVAVDVSPAMLAVLRERAPDAEHVRAGFLTYEHTGEPVDAVHTRNALHQLPDFFKALALRRIADVLRPGGLLRVRDLVHDFAPDEAAAVLGRWMDGAVSDPALGYTREEFVQHVRTEHSTFRWLFEPMLDAAGFDVLDVEFRASVYGAYTCVKR